MKVIAKNNHSMLLRFDKGEDVIHELTTFAKEEQITAASFTALGACSEVMLSYYHIDEKSYEDRKLYEDLEIVSVTGNIAVMKEKPVIHAHGVFSDVELDTHGGHIKSLIVSATCEVMLTLLDGKMTREFDEDTGLNLLK